MGIVRLFSVVGLSLGAFVFFEPFVEFKKKSLELAHVRVSGFALNFDASPIDAYIRWLNIEMVKERISKLPASPSFSSSSPSFPLLLFLSPPTVASFLPTPTQMLSFGLHQLGPIRKRLDRMYLGFLDSQICWACAPRVLPKGFDQRAPFRFFSIEVHPIANLIMNVISLPLLLVFPIWPSIFALHFRMMRIKFWLARLRFGGRQPRLGGVFLNNPQTAMLCGMVNWNGCVEVFQMNLKTLCFCFRTPLLETRFFEQALDRTITWTVAPAPACGGRIVYLLCPFPFDKSDEDDLTLDETIPIIADNADMLDLYGFRIPKTADPNELNAEDISWIFSLWSKRSKERKNILISHLELGRTGLFKKAKAIDAATTTPFILKMTRNAGGVAKTTLSVRELQPILETMSLLASDERCKSPLFARNRTRSTAALFSSGRSAGGSGSSTQNPSAVHYRSGV